MHISTHQWPVKWNDMQIYICLAHFNLSPCCCPHEYPTSIFIWWRMIFQVWPFTPPWSLSIEWDSSIFTPSNHLISIASSLDLISKNHMVWLHNFIWSSRSIDPSLACSSLLPPWSTNAKPSTRTSAPQLDCPSHLHTVLHSQVLPWSSPSFSGEATLCDRGPSTLTT